MEISRMSKPKIAIYPGSFDPITNGHLDIIRRAAALFDQLRVGIGINAQKSGMFNADERAELIKQACDGVDLPPDVVHIDAFKGLVTDYAVQANAVAVVRGLRTISDFEFEFQFAHVARQLKPGIEIVLLPTVEENSYVSSSIVKELARHGGDLEKFVPACVLAALNEKLGGPQ
jgi:pantetheine-phosphate adenylyltransferase